MDIEYKMLKWAYREDVVTNVMRKLMKVEPCISLGVRVVDVKENLPVKMGINALREVFCSLEDKGVIYCVNPESIKRRGFLFAQEGM